MMLECKRSITERLHNINWNNCRKWKIKENKILTIRRENIILINCSNQLRRKYKKTLNSMNNKRN